MAPRKKTEKDEKATSAEGSDMILHYLRQTNRPYSAIDVSGNLKNKVTKAAAAKLLKDLHDQKLIEGRASGKAIVYHALQNPDDAISPEQLAEYDARASTLQTQTTEHQTLAKTLRSTLSSLNSTLSTADTLLSMSALENEKAELATRLKKLRAGHEKKVTVRERQKVETEYNMIKGVSARREKIVREFWKMVEDGTEERFALEEMRQGWGLDD